MVDTTGCGDVFHGAFIFGLLQRWSLRKTALFANAIAAIKCTGIGGRSAIPTRSKAVEFLRSRTTGSFETMK
jgi:sulfofructose kinase